jgi:oligosaccharide repeat unit polymerase
MVRHPAITEPPGVDLRIPNVARPAAFLFVALVFYGGIRTLFLTGKLPLIWPVIAALVSAGFLIAVNRARDPVGGLARLGFHVGLFAYFLSLPILFPEMIEPSLTDEVHQIIGWMLLLVIVGFEAGYKLKVLIFRGNPTTRTAARFGRKQRRLFKVLIFLGLTTWFLATIDYSVAARVSVLDILFAMRGPLAGGIENPVPQLGVWSYILTGGLYLATAAAFVLLNRRPLNRGGSVTLITIIYWSVMLLCSLLGFLSGSRALFLYSFVPLALAFWIRLSNAHLGKVLRLLTIILAGAIVVGAWLAMTTMRGRDVRTYEGSLEEINPLDTAKGAFDIYSSSAIIVQSFPEKIDYEYGRSLLPLVLGWLPRSLWPGKPYPFSIYANTIKGETLEDRSASIAVGLPGEGYGNFGLVGVLLWGGLMGFACRFADDYLRRFHPSDPLRLFLGASMCIWAAMIVRGGVPEMFYMGLQVNLFPIALSLMLKAIGNRTRWVGISKSFNADRSFAGQESLSS